MTPELHPDDYDALLLPGGVMNPDRLRMNEEAVQFVKAIVDAETNQILGAAVLSVEGGELMSMFEIAMMGKLPYPVLKDAIFAHPTLAESLNNLFMAMDK